MQVIEVDQGKLSKHTFARSLIIEYISNCSSKTNHLSKHPLQPTIGNAIMCMDI